MAKGLPLSEGELRLLASLVHHRVRFMVVGLSAAALQGAPVVTEDVDLWFEDLNDPELHRALREVGAAYVPPFQLNPPMLAGKHSEPFDVVIRMDGLGPFAEEIRHCHEVRLGCLRLKVLSLERILASKIAADRPKDRRVTAVLRNTLLTLKLRKRGRGKTAATRKRRNRKQAR